jgi:hypothetical protein
MSIAGLGDAELEPVPTAGVFARNHPAVAHDLLRRREAGHLADLDSDDDRTELFDPSHRLQCVDDSFHPGRGMFNSMTDRGLQSFEPLGHVLHFVNVVGESIFERLLVEVDSGFYPLHVMGRPGSFQAVRTMTSVSQQKGSETTTGTMLVATSGFASANEIPQSFVLGVGDPAGSKITGSVTLGQFESVAMVGFHLIAGFRGDETRSNDIAVDSECGQLPVQNVAGRPGLVTNFQKLRVAELLDELSDGLPRPLRSATGNGHNQNAKTKS